MNDLEMRLGKDITDILEKKNIVVFRSETTNQPYVLIKLKNEVGAITDLGNGVYIVPSIDHKSKNMFL